jgi:transmembrane sensor
MQTTKEGMSFADSPDRLAQASDWFVRLRAEDANVDSLARFQRWLEADPGNAPAYRKICASWAAIGEHASSPEIMTGRRDALEDARRAARGRWRGRPSGRLAWAAAVAGIVIIASIGFWSHTRADLYSTGVGERRTLTLNDGSVVTLDARSRIRVKYRENERSIELQEGQARFDVAKDPSRPFRVEAGNETIVALGTKFNVELVARNVLVTMIEGHVAVTDLNSTSPTSGNAETRGRGGAVAHTVIELTAGEALHVRQDGKTTRLSEVNLGRVTAWQDGKMFFDNEPLSTAAERVNRYARERIQVDPSAANVNISGVFNTGDANAFIEAVTSYFPVQAERAEGSTVHLTLRKTGLP